MKSIVAVILALAVCGDCFAQSDDAKVRRGEIVEDITAVANPDQKYALYLPTDYHPDKSPPVLLLMDPRGRARIPLDLFVRAAEDFGYVVLSSYGTLSDDPTAFDQNDDALDAMLADARSRFKTDSQRVYLVGFSGTAHFAWNVASELDGSLAGIVGVGGGLPAYTKPIQMGMAMQRPFAFFGIAGIGDFNYDGVRWLDEALDTTRVQHRFVSHDGRHEWPSEAIAYESIRWFQLQAMRVGTIPRADRFLKRLLDDYLREADRLERDGNKASAWRRYREITADFEPFGLGDDARSRFQQLAGDQDVVEEQHRRDLLSREVQLYKLAVRDFRIAYRSADAPMDHGEALRRLRIEELQEKAKSRNYQESGAASRMLASAHATVGFYEPRDYLRTGEYARAEAILQLAVEIYGRIPRTCYQMAQARSQLGRIEEAREDLACAAEADWVTKELIESDPLLKPLLQSR